MNIFLHGNGHWCAACRGTGRGDPRDRIEYRGGGYCQFYEPCPACKGERRVAGPGPSLAAPRSLFSPLAEWGQA